MEIDLTPLAEQAVNLAGAVFLALASWVAYKAKAYVGEKYADQIRGYLQDAVAMGVSYAINKVRDEKLSVNVKDQMVALAVSYVLARVPDALKQFGITEDGVKAMVEARLGLIDIVDTTKDAAVMGNIGSAHAVLSAAPGMSRRVAL